MIVHTRVDVAQGRVRGCRKLEELVHRAEAKAAGVPVIRRFSGGGTVAVDQDTIFATLVSDDKTLPEVCTPAASPSQL